MQSKLLTILVLCLCQFSSQMNLTKGTVETLRLEDPLSVATLVSSASPFSTGDPGGIGEVCIITMDDVSKSISLTPSPALFKRMGVEVQRSSGEGNVTAINEMLHDGYNKAITKRLVTAGAIASFYSIVRKVIATAAVYYSAKALYDNPLFEPQPPTLKITFTPKNVDIMKPETSDSPKDLILLVSTVGGSGFETLTIPDDIIGPTFTDSESTSLTATATPTQIAQCPTGNMFVKCDDASCLGVKAPVGTGKICTKDGPFKGCSCSHCSTTLEDQLICSDQTSCKGKVSSEESLTAQCTLGDQESCACRCGLLTEDTPLCDVDSAKCLANKQNTCQAQTENTIGCECMAKGNSTVDQVDKDLAFFLVALNSKLGSSETSGYMSLTTMLPPAVGDTELAGKSITAAPNATTSSNRMASSITALSATVSAISSVPPTIQCDKIDNLNAANWTSRYWGANGDWVPEVVAADHGKDYDTLTNQTPWRYNNAQFLTDPINQFCIKVVTEMPTEGFAADTIYTADLTSYNKDSLEEVQFRIEIPTTNTVIRQQDCVANLNLIAPACQIFPGSNFAVWGGNAYVNGVGWYILPQYLRQPAVQRPTVYARANYAPGRTTWEAHGAGILTNDYGVGLYEPGGFQKGASNSGGHVFYTPSGFADPYGMEWWANGQFELKTTSIRKEYVEEGISDHGGPLNSITWWNERKVSWVTDWNRLFTATCIGSKAGCAAKSLVPRPVGG